MLTDNVHILHKGDLESEDILATGLASLYPDDTNNQHGGGDDIVLYDSQQFGEISLTLADPAAEASRKLFAHYLWNAAIWLATAMSEAEKGSKWDVNGESVLEVGAGAALSGIVAALAGAARVVLSDYPDPKILANIRNNVTTNFEKRSAALTRPLILGHEWGVLDDDFSKANKASFSRVIAADCLWMPWEHESLARSIKHFLTPEPTARAFIVAGFHTGRSKVAAFFDVLGDAELALEHIEEVDVQGNVRAWAKERNGGREDVSERKRWLAVAVLKHADKA